MNRNVSTPHRRVVNRFNAKIAGDVCAISGLLGIIAARSRAIDIPIYDKPPVQEGALDDPAWQNAAKISAYHLENTNTPVTDTTVISPATINGFTWDSVPQFQHGACRPDGVQARRHLSNFYANESVEIYLKPDRRQDRYYWLS